MMHAPRKCKCSSSMHVMDPFIAEFRWNAYVLLRACKHTFMDRMRVHSTSYTPLGCMGIAAQDMTLSKSEHLMLC